MRQPVGKCEGGFWMCSHRFVPMGGGFGRNIASGTGAVGGYLCGCGWPELCC